MTQVAVRGESVYQCTTCTRSVRIPTNREGLDVMQNCIITRGCLGKLRRLTLQQDVNNTPATTPSVAGVQDWFQRTVLYVHTQPVQSKKWVLRHNLSAHPIIHAFVNRVVDGETQLVEVQPASIKVLDSNAVEITFATAASGVAQCIAVASQKTTATLNYAATAVDSTIQLSSNTGEVTLATLIDAPLISFVVNYNTSGSSLPASIEYTGVEIGPSAESPWAGSRKAIINGKLYTLRSYNLTRTPLAPAYFDAGVVPNGSTFYFSKYNNSAIRPGDVLFVLGRDPYGPVDRNTTAFVDASSINVTTPEAFFDDSRAYVSTSLVKQTYPHILVV